MSDAKERMHRALEMGVRGGTWSSDRAREAADRVDAASPEAITPAAVASWLGVDSSVVSSLFDLADSFGPTPATLRVARDAAASPSPRMTTPTTPDDEPPPAPRPRMPHKLGRYVIKDILGEGGMGIVYLAEHEELKTPCAVKVLSGGTGFSPKALERFRREAAAVARMGKHANIVTVYDLGVDEREGVTYFAMELVKGRSLKETLRARDFGVKEAATLVEKVARAVHHAHKNGVLHRDLKPDNVMVREGDGEPLVVDFGLAREVGTEAGKSLAGVGTPNYMAPEQARGQDDRIDARTDVYGLGGILYEALTHLPPHPGQEVPRVLMHVLRGEVLPPRKARPDVPRDLETVCLKCLDPELAKRYATAEALADDLARFQRGEMVTARPVGRVGRSVRWVRRNPVASAAAVAVFAALFGGIGLAEWRASARRQAEYATLVADAEARLARLPGNQEGAIGELVTVEERLRTAQELMAAHGGGPLPRRYEVNRELGDKALEGRDYLLAKLAFSVCRSVDARRAEADGLDKRVEEAKQREAQRRKGRIETALQDLSNGLGRPGRERGAPDLDDYVFEVSGYRDEQTVELLARAIAPLREKGEHAGEGTHWTQEEQEVMTFAFRVLGRLGLDSAVDPLSGMMGVLRDHALVVECGTALCNTRSARANAVLFRAQDRLGTNSSTWRAIERSLPRVPGSVGSAEPTTAAALVERGLVRQAKGDLDGAIGDYTRAIELDPTCASALSNRGRVRLVQGRIEEAIEDGTRAIALDPRSAGAFTNRGNARQAKGDLAGAIQDYTSAIDLDPKSPIAFNNRGNARRTRGDLKGANDDFTSAIGLDPGYVDALNNRGLARMDQGDVEGAIQDHTRAIELDPKDPISFCARGAAFRAKGDYEGAIHDQSRAIELNPKCADAFCSRGATRGAAGDLEGAVADLDRAIQLDSKLVGAFNNRGNVRKAKGDLAGAIEDYARAIDLDSKNAVAFRNRATARQAAGDLEGAIEDDSRAIDLVPTDAAAVRDRAIARQAKGDRAGAIQDYSRVIELDPKSSQAYNNRGIERKAQGDLDGAILDYSRAIELDPKYADVFNNRGNARQAKGDLEGAIQDFTHAIEIDPAYAAAFSNRAFARGSAGDMDKAIEDCTRAIALDPRCASAYGNRATARQARGDWAEAIADWEKRLELSPQDANASRVRSDLANAHYSLACSQSLASAGKGSSSAGAIPVTAAEAARLRDDAIQHLREAVKLGFADAKSMEADADLVPLHDDPRWAELLRRIRSK